MSDIYTPEQRDAAIAYLDLGSTKDKQIVSDLILHPEKLGEERGIKIWK